jgi:hypothetical protein
MSSVRAISCSRHQCGQVAGARRTQHVLGGLETRAAVLIVDEQKIKSGIGTHFHQSGRCNAIEDTAQALTAAQHVGGASIKRPGRFAFHHGQSSLLAISAPSAMLASLA